MEASDLIALRFVYIVAALLGVLSLYLLFTSVLIRYASRYVEHQDLAEVAEHQDY